MTTVRICRALSQPLRVVWRESHKTTKLRSYETGETERQGVNSVARSFHEIVVDTRECLAQLEQRLD